jgi:hypothetical protein
MRFVSLGCTAVAAVAGALATVSTGPSPFKKCCAERELVGLAGMEPVCIYDPQTREGEAHPIESFAQSLSLNNSQANGTTFVEYLYCYGGAGMRNSTALR